MRLLCANYLLQVVPVAYDCITERRLSKTIYCEKNACQFAVSCRRSMFKNSNGVYHQARTLI